MKGYIAVIVSVCLLMLSAVLLHAQTLEECMGESIKTASPTLTVGELETSCEEQLQALPKEKYSKARERLAMEKRTEWNPFVITPHLSNYILPYSYVKDPNQGAYDAVGEIDKLDNTEAKLQISLKVPLNENDLFVFGDGIYFAFTLKAFWQVYNHEISAPFRETNYRPEIFYFMPLEAKPGGADTALSFGFEHESNGRTQLLSRSWNRIFVNYFYARDNYLLQFRPWYRLSEKDKKDPLDSSGDDNPDIYKYMGYFELLGVWERNQYEFSVLLRNNLNSDNHGALEFNASFPLFGRIRGVVQYFDGYGDSMIDYDHRIERIGFGILLTDIL